MKMFCIPTAPMALGVASPPGGMINRFLFPPRLNISQMEDYLDLIPHFSFTSLALSYASFLYIFFLCFTIPRPAELNLIAICSDFFYTIKKCTQIKMCFLTQCRCREENDPKKSPRTIL